MKVMIAVTHLLGTGHLVRMIALGRGFLAQGDEVMIVSGGVPVPYLDHDGIDLVQLPPVKTVGGDFKNLKNADGQPRTAADTAARIEMQNGAFATFAPDVLITELFPFGRRTVREEYLSLLEAARAAQKRPLILASVRDILEPPTKEGRAEQSNAWAEALYDGVLVHSSQEFMPLEKSWPMSETLRETLHYTGFVSPPLPVVEAEGAGAGEILVTAGGGSVGSDLFGMALKAAGLMPGAFHWRLLIGGEDKAARIEAFRAAADGLPVTVEATRADFRELLQRASLLVSQCGYNTALDVLSAEKPAVFVPFEVGGETEQLNRAEALLRVGPYTIVREENLTAENLVLAVSQALSSRKSPDRSLISLDGGDRTAGIVRGLWEDWSA